MPFYKEVKPQKMTKRDHLRQADWSDEGTRYHGKSDRPAEGKPDARPTSGKPYARPAQTGNKPYGRPAGDKPYARPAGDKPYARPAGDKPYGRPAGDKPYGRPSGDKPYGRPAGDKPYARPSGDKPYGRPAGDKPYGRPAGDKPYARPAAPMGNKPYGRPAPVAPAPVAAPIATPVEEDRNLPPENLLTGRNPIREAIKSGHDIEKLLVAKGDLSASAREIIAMARDRGIVVQMVERTRLDEIARNHQGMLAFASAHEYFEVEDMLADAKAKNEDPFLIVLDGLTDPQNLGAIIRTAACVGAHGVIIPKRRAAGLTPVAVKASAGAVEFVKVARVTNLTRTLQELQQQGVWLYGADMQGEDYRAVNFKGPVALVVGSEGEGVSRLVLDQCDHRVSLPMSGVIDSLNASVAAGILMYAAYAARK